MRTRGWRTRELGALDHASHTHQLMSCNYYVLLVVLVGTQQKRVGHINLIWITSVAHTTCGVISNYVVFPSLHKYAYVLLTLICNTVHVAVIMRTIMGEVVRTNMPVCYSPTCHV